MQTQKYPAHFLVKCRAFFIRADAVWDFMEFLLKSVDYAAQKVLFYGHRESVKNKGNTAQFPPYGISGAPAAAARHLHPQKILDNTQNIICAFGLASAVPRSPYWHLE